MRDWDKTIDELRKNIDNARKRWVLPYLDPIQIQENSSENSLDAQKVEKKVSSGEVSDSQKINSGEDKGTSQVATEEALSTASKEEKVEEVPKVDAGQVDTMLDEVKAEEASPVEVKEEKVEKIQKVDAGQVDAMLDEVKAEEASPVEVKEEKVEEVPKVDAGQVDAMLDEVKAEEASPVEVKEEKVEEVPKVDTFKIEEKKPLEKPKKGKKKVEEIKPDMVAQELLELEAINEDDLSEEQEDRLMELRRIKTQRAMHEEVDEQFKSEMKQADEEIKTLKSQLKIKDALPKGYVE